MNLQGIDKADPANGPTRTPVSFSFNKKAESFLTVFFFALLFYLCCADQYFSTKWGPFHIRWGQILLWAPALLSLGQNWNSLFNRAKEQSFPIQVLTNWGWFFLIYALAAILSGNTQITLIKVGWGFMNISCAALVFLNPKSGDKALQGASWGLFAVAGTLWVQAIAAYWFGATTPLGQWCFTGPLNFLVHPLPFPLGFVQSGTQVGLHQFLFRPSAFYYEPSYAGCALAFGFPLSLALESRWESRKIPIRSALILSSILLVGSRSGFLGILVGLLFVGGYSLRFSLPEIRRSLLITITGAALAILVFAVTPSSREYLSFIGGLSTGQVATGPPQDPHKSEKGRIDTYFQGLKDWAQHPILGNGVARDSSGEAKVTVTTDNMWLEVGMESGLLGFTAFVWGFFGSLKRAWKGGPPTLVKALVLGALVCHFTINMNLCQTFPRLDYWILFFMALGLLNRDPD